MKWSLKKRKTLSSRAIMAIEISVAFMVIALCALVFSEGCTTTTIRPSSSNYRPPITRKIVATGYCNCRKCCSWQYNWYGKPVLTSNGKSKKIGITASGTRARIGTIAADTSIYPFGTLIEIPGYGIGRVEDRGGAIKGQRLDLWFPRHNDAVQWGKKEITVRIWLPK